MTDFREIKEHIDILERETIGNIRIAARRAVDWVVVGSLLIGLVSLACLVVVRGGW